MPFTPLSTGQLAARLGVSRETVRNYTAEFSEFLSAEAVGVAPNAKRRYSERDSLMLATVADLKNTGLSPTQIKVALKDGRLVDKLPDAPSPDESEARARIALVPAAERDRYLDRIQTLESELNDLRTERDRAIERWQADTSELNARIASLERELGEARGALNERLPVAVTLRIAAVFILGLLVFLALAVLYFGSRAGG